MKKTANGKEQMNPSSDDATYTQLVAALRSAHRALAAAILEAFQITGEERYFERFKLVSDWVWSHLKDPEHPEWFGYLHRDGTVAQPAKGNIFKGPYHIPRMLVKCILTAEFNK